MLFKLQMSEDAVAKRIVFDWSAIRYHLCYALMALIFGGVLMLSALNGFLFFGWLAGSMLIVLGLMTIHLIQNQQTTKTKS